ncbi:MAG: hypothetical protein LBR38_03250 [Synergistaceae bacterium]|nr:hypothetical protein [Synergistaceae bacterium]
MTVLFESDWLGSRPYFYNTKTGVHGDNVNDVIDWGNVEIDLDGLRDYLEFGYSVFGHTMVKNVRVLPPSSQLVRAEERERERERERESARALFFSRRSGAAGRGRKVALFRSCAARGRRVGAHTLQGSGLGTRA